MTRPEHVPADLVVDFDVLGDLGIPQAHAEASRWRREKGPVVWTDRNGGYWIVVGAEEIRRGLVDVSLFDSASRGVKMVTIEPREALVPLELDGEEHTTYRRILNPFFAPRRMRLLEDDVRKVARQLLAELAPTGSCEVVADFARPLASSMFLSMVDWPLEDRVKLENWVKRQVNGVAGESEEANRRIQAEALEAVTEYCRGQITSRRERPREDMTSTLMNATVDGAPIPDERLVGLLIVLAAGGLDTTASVTSQAVELFALHPDMQAYVREDGSRIPAVVEEMLRVGAPVGPLRAALRDTELGGVEIKAGDRVHFLGQAGSRDPAEFPDPDRVDLQREPNRHMAFGLGPHRCIGAALARVVLAVAFDEFHAVIPPYRLVGSESRLGAVWGMSSVVVEWDVDEVVLP
ncbi:cytochrome P450 [Pseudonocardia pini]|uniref:cytochrome P450 n=1 Tax=Pseudonocardia pini TaxID=2758030 RepID=UPI0015F0F215|nr:cytochrome P450 [Pseudonocardia pini]